MNVTKYKGRKAVLIAAERRCTTGIATYVIQILYVNNQLIEATYYSKIDASGSVFNLVETKVIANEAIIPEFDKLLGK